MNKDCKIVGDLLPLYAEDMVSDETKEYVECHLAECEECRASFKKMSCAELEAEMGAAPLKDVKKKLCRKRLKAVTLATLLVLTLAVAAFSYLTAPQYVSYDDVEYEFSVIMEYADRMEQLAVCHRINGENSMTCLEPNDNKGTGNARIMFSFPDKVTRCSIECFVDEDGVTHCFVSAWYTLLDRWIGKDCEITHLVELTRGDKLAVWYAQNNGEEDVPIFDLNAKQSGGTQTLPRHNMAYYFLISLLLAAILCVLWIVFRKKPAGRILKKLFFLPVSWLCGSIAVQGFDFASYSPMRDLSLTVIAAVLIYCAVLIIINMAERKREMQ